MTVLFKNTVYPIIGFDTQDLSAIEPASTGAFRCSRGFLGRSDNMVKLRGINVYPTGIATLLTTWPETNGEYLCRVRREGAREEMLVQIEWEGVADSGATERVAAQLQNALGVRVDVELVQAGSTAALTEVESRQKPRRLLDERS